MSNFNSGNLPGFRAKIESEEKEITWCSRDGLDLAATKKVVVKSSALDEGNTPTTTLRGGLVVAIKESDGNVYPYDPDASDGTQIAIGILEKHQDMLVEGVPTDRFSQVLVQGMVRESQLIGLDPRAKEQLGGRFLFDRDLGASSGVLMHPCGVVRKAVDYSIGSGDNGLLFIATAAVGFTLPSKQNGLAFRFLQTADATMRIVGSSDLISTNTVSGSQVAFQTTDQKIGSHALVECVYTATGTLRWLVTNLGGTTATIS